MKVGELFVDLFIKTDDSKLKDFIHDLGELRMSSLLNTLGLAEMYEGIKKIMEVGDRTALAINNFTAQTGQSSQEFQKWSKFAKQFGLDASVVAQSVATLEDNIMGLRLTGAGANAYQMLGIDPRGFKDYFQLLGALRERLKGLPIETQRFFLAQLGLSKELVQLFNVSDQEWASIAENITVSNENLARMREYHKQINKLGADWETFVTHIAAIFAPLADVLINVLDTVIKVGDKFSDWIGPLITIAGLALKIAGIFNPLVRAVTIFGALMTGGEILGKLGVFSPEVTPQIAGGSGGSRTQNNRINFHITGNNPQDIARAVDKRLQEHLSDAEYQTPLQNN